MKKFLPYVRQIEKLVYGKHKFSVGQWQEACVLCLNGGPGRTLREVADLNDIRECGAFFTPSVLADKAIGAIAGQGNSEAMYLDPTCGTGDLLLAIGRILPLRKTVQATLKAWGKCLAGYDISGEFIRATKARLVLLAMQRLNIGFAESPKIPNDLFPLIRQGDALTETSLFSLAERIVMNPPFGLTKIPIGCDWAEGRVNAAAIFVDTVSRKSREGTKVAAILPDVLRSGERYSSWRNTISELAVVTKARPHGIFDRWTDVDVFLLTLSIGNPKGKKPCGLWVPTAGKGEKTIGHYFKVHVGAVVPHRHKEKGAERRYIHARSLPAWGSRKRITEKLRFEGRSFSPPFVAVRRISRPDDSKRAVATIILGKKKVAVENHLVVLLPLDGSLERCKQLVERLKSMKTDEWLNERIRCRHLTVSSLSEIPWWGKP